MESGSSETLTVLAYKIRDYLKTHKTYCFRPVKIDGIYCYIAIHEKFKIINVESIYVFCNVKINNSFEKQKYSLYHSNYKTIEDAILQIEKIYKEYKIYNGELVSKRDYEIYKLEEQFLPYSENEQCSVCFENTNDLTTCNHSICLHCRENCLMKNIVNCPICRAPNSLSIYKINNGLINNEQYPIVKKANYYEDKKQNMDNLDDYFHDENSDSDSDSDSDQNQDLDLTQEEEDNQQENQNQIMDQTDYSEDQDYHDYINMLYYNEDYERFYNQLQSERERFEETERMEESQETQEISNIIVNESITHDASFQENLRNYQRISRIEETIPWRISRSPSHDTLDISLLQTTMNELQNEQF